MLATIISQSAFKIISDVNGFINMYHLIFSSHSNPNKIFPKEFLIRIFGKREFL